MNVGVYAVSMSQDQEMTHIEAEEVDLVHKAVSPPSHTDLVSLFNLFARKLPHAIRLLMSTKRGIADLSSIIGSYHLIKQEQTLYDHEAETRKLTLVARLMAMVMDTIKGLPDHDITSTITILYELATYIKAGKQ